MMIVCAGRSSDTGAWVHGVSWLCQLVVSVGCVSWLCRLVVSVGGVGWWCRLVVSVGGAGFFEKTQCIIFLNF
jgi:hypothetical protein